MTHPTHLAVLDDEIDITRLLGHYLQSQGFRVTELHNGSALMELMGHRDAPALVLLDLGLPGEDGFAIARQLREHWHCGLVIVTGRGDAIDKVVGLEVGADDYVTKPFDLRELVARVKAVLRRIEPARAGGPAGASGAGSTRPRRRSCASRNGGSTPPRRLCDEQATRHAADQRRVRPAQRFARAPGRVLSRDYLLEQTRGRSARPVRPHDRRAGGPAAPQARARPEDPQIIKSVRGAGYILVPRWSPNDGPAAADRPHVSACRARTKTACSARCSPPTPTG